MAICFSAFAYFSKHPSLIGLHHDGILVAFGPVIAIVLDVVLFPLYGLTGAQISLLLISIGITFIKVLFAKKLLKIKPFVLI